MTRAIQLLLVTALASGCVDRPLHTGAAAPGDEGRYLFMQRTEPAPATVGPVTLFVDVHTVDGAPATIESMEASWLMVAHGHGAIGTALVTKTGEGSFRIDGTNLTMAGPWQLDLRASGAAGVDEASFEIDVR